MNGYFSGNLNSKKKIGFFFKVGSKLYGDWLSFIGFLKKEIAYFKYQLTERFFSEELYAAKSIPFSTTACH